MSILRVAIIAAAMFFTVQASASTVYNVDFKAMSGTTSDSSTPYQRYAVYSGPGPGGDGGTYWNGVQVPDLAVIPTTSLKDSHGGTSSVTLSTGTTTVTWFDAHSKTKYWKPLTYDGLAAGTQAVGAGEALGHAVRMTFSGLQASTPYHFFLISGGIPDPLAPETANALGGEFSFSKDNYVTKYRTSGTSSGTASVSGGLEHVNWVKALGIFTDGSGNTTLQIDANGYYTSQVGILQGLQIVPSLFGDSNGDNTVNSTDLGLLLSHYNQTVPSGQNGWSIGDFNNDNTVNSTDLGLLLSHYNQVALAMSAVPEPSTLLLILVGLVGLSAYGRRKEACVRES
jgi:hypothetical protein